MPNGDPQSYPPPYPQPPYGPPAAPWPGQAPANPPQPGYAPQPGYPPQPGYAPQPGYVAPGPSYPAQAYPQAVFPAAAWTAPPIRRRRNLLAIFIGGPLLLGVLGYAALDGYNAAYRHPAGSHAVATVSAAPVHAADLKTYMMPAPANSKPWTTEPADETLDLAGEASFSSDATAARTVLNRYHYRRGFIRRWKDGHTIVAVRLLQFASADDALGYYDTAETADSLSDWGAGSPVPGIAHNALSFVSSATDKNGYQYALGMAAKDDLVVIVDSDQVAPAKASLAEAVLTAECRRL